MMRRMKALIFGFSGLVTGTGCSPAIPNEPTHFIALDMKNIPFRCDDLRESLIVHDQVQFIADYEHASDYRFSQCRDFIDQQHSERCQKVALQVTLPINHHRLIGWEQFIPACEDELGSIITSMMDDVELQPNSMIINGVEYSFGGVQDLTEPMPGKYEIPTWHLYFSYDSQKVVVTSQQQESLQRIHQSIVDHGDKHYATL